jgi:hypothetical protein
MRTTCTTQKIDIMQNIMYNYEQMDMCVEHEHELGVPDWLMARVHVRRNWYLLPDNSYESLEAYTDATRAAL